MLLPNKFSTHCKALLLARNSAFTSTCPIFMTMCHPMSLYSVPGVPEPLMPGLLLGLALTFLELLELLWVVETIRKSSLKSCLCWVIAAI